jgi:hypothetical protein
MAVSEDEKARRSATQETIGPLKGGAKAAGLGLAGVFLLGFGIIILEVALLRVLQRRPLRSRATSCPPSRM